MHEKEDYSGRFICCSNRLAACNESAAYGTVVDGCTWWNLCNSGSKDAVWRIGSELYEPCIGSKMFPDDFFTSLMTNFNCDTYTGATPLAALKAGERVDVMDMIIGRTAGTIGETSMVALIIGACILILLGVIDLKVPGSYIVTFVIFIAIFGGHGFDSQYISANLAGGGLMLGAFFMATDYVTRPITKKGQYLYGIFLGIMTGIFRVFGPSAEGVSYAIILGNLLVPLIEKVTMPKAFGKGGERA